MTESGRFWSDDFDMDLPKVLPGVWDLAQQAPTIPIYTQGHRSYGRLNHPAVWNHHDGMVAFFGFDQVCGKPSHYVCGGEVVECTFAEVIRDGWPHGYRVLLEGREIWNSERVQWAFNALMYDLRGWHDRLPASERFRVTSAVLRSVGKAVQEFSMVCADKRARLRHDG